MAQSKGLNRNTIDKYYTKESIVLECISSIKNILEISNDDLIIEPSCGNGSFISEIKKLTNNYKFYDLQPENDEIEKQDYLLLQNPISDKKIHVIGNPPFGRQASLAVKFVKKSCEYADSVSFILPKSFKKDSIKNKIPLNFTCVCEYDLPYKSFLVDGIEYDVPCVFQIWKKSNQTRIIPEKVEPIGYMFVKQNETPDISVRRVGFYSGKVDIDITKSPNSHYFIKFTNGFSVSRNIKKLENIKFVHNNTVGSKSLSKPELIEKFNPILKKNLIIVDE
jgi:predicted RNA methylase